MRVSYRYIRPVSVVFARSLGPYEHSSRAAWRTLSNWMDAQGLRSQVKRGFGVFRDNPLVTDEEVMRYDACIEGVPGIEADPDAGIGWQTLPGGAHAVYTHIGSYGPTGELFSQLHREYVPKRGLVVDYDRPFVAIYLNDPKITRKVHRRTELCVPVLPIKMPVAGNDYDEETNFAASARYSAAAG